jgi:hypothetical protein
MPFGYLVLGEEEGRKRGFVEGKKRPYKES